MFNVCMIYVNSEFILWIYLNCCLFIFLCLPTIMSISFAITPSSLSLPFPLSLSLAVFRDFIYLLKCPAIALRHGALCSLLTNTTTVHYVSIQCNHYCVTTIV